MKKMSGLALSAALSVTLCVPQVAFAMTAFVQNSAQTHAAKARKTYLKQQKKSAKSQNKAQQKVMKRWKKLHERGN